MRIAPTDLRFQARPVNRWIAKCAVRAPGACPAVFLEIEAIGKWCNGGPKPRHFFARLRCADVTHTVIARARCMSLSGIARQLTAVDLAPHIEQLDRFRADLERQ